MKRFINLLLCFVIVFTLSNQVILADDGTTLKNSAKKELTDLFSLYDEFYYSEENWQIMQKTYENGIQNINSSASDTEIYDSLNQAAEALISVHHKGETIKVCFAADKFTLNKGFITYPQFIKTRIYTPVSNVIYGFYTAEFENKTRNPIYYTGTTDHNFEVTGIYEGLTRTIDTPEEFELPNYLYNFVGRTLPERADLTHLKNGDYTAESQFVYSVNNRFPNVKASAVPVCSEDVIRLQFSLYGKGADVGANIYGGKAPISKAADKSEAFWKIAEIHEQNDINLLLSNPENKEKYTKALGALMISNLSQNASDKALDKLEALVPVLPGEETPNEPEQEEILPETSKPIIFTDVTDSHFAKNAIEHMSSKGYISGRPDGSFGTGDNITRGEFATILSRINGFDEKGISIPFTDVSAEDWYYNGIAFCYTNKISNGQSPDTFNPNANITREELATMLYRYVKFADIVFSVQQTIALFADETEISEYAFEAVTELRSASIISGYEGNIFMPKGNATRGEAVKMIYNIIK